MSYLSSFMDVVNELLVEVNKCYKIAISKSNSCCTTRSQLLYYVLKKKERNPTLLRYFTSKNQDERVKFKLISGEEFISHVVVMLDDDILDSNLNGFLCKREYEKRLHTINKGLTIKHAEYQIRPNLDELRRIVDNCKLSHHFLSIFTES